MKKTTILLLPILVLIASGCATNQNIELSDSSDLNKGAILIATPNQNQTPPPNNDANLMREYKIIAFDPTTGEEKLLTTLKNNFFIEPYELYDNQIFYVNTAGEIDSYDIYSDTINSVNIPGIFPTDKYLDEDTIDDFIIEGIKIIYLKGYCGERYACTLGEFNISNKENKIVIENLEDHVSSSLFNVFKLRSYNPDTNILTFSNSGGDAGIADIAIYEVDMSTGTLNKVDSADYNGWCNGEFSEECEDEVIVENQHFEEIVAKLDFGTKECSGAKITKGDHSQNYAIMINSDKHSANYEQGVYIGCVE